MADIYILHENDEWTAPLLEELDRLGADYEAWHMHEGHVPMHEAPPEGVFYNRMSASSHTRGHRYAPELTAAVLNWLEQHGRTVLNGSRALYLEVSKAAQYASLETHGIRVPKTTAAVGDDALLQSAASIPVPFITKHNRAGKGLGVQRFDSVDALAAALETGTVDPSVDGVMLLQQYIDSPDSSIVRCEFVNGKFLYAVKVDTGGSFELCPADACSLEESYCPTDAASASPSFEIIEHFDSPLIPKYEAFLQANGIAFAGIEQMTDRDGTTYTYDVNTNTNYNREAEVRYGTSGMKEIARTLVNAAKGAGIESY
ncbi:RimK family alpha-L-glutamate ligase [Bacillus daqingensis]|uniref:RimK family alpha-L-glutamate ligase n=1 Tax=Bacillus daqingensis TaxID=872396 RepID=A0ABV9NST5_9BACI